MKNKLDDDSNAMMIKKNWKFSVFYVNFPNNIFQMFHAVVLIICDLL